MILRGINAWKKQIKDVSYTFISNKNDKNE